MNPILLSVMIILVLDGTLIAFEHVELGTTAVVVLGLAALGIAIRRRF